MFYILDFVTHRFISCSNADEVFTRIQDLMKEGVHRSDLEIINGIGEEIRFDVDQFTSYCKTLSLTEQSDLKALDLAWEKKGEQRDRPSIKIEIGMVGTIKNKEGIKKSLQGKTFVVTQVDGNGYITGTIEGKSGFYAVLRDDLENLSAPVAARDRIFQDKSIAEWSLEGDPPDVEALKGEISNLRHELNGVIGREGDEELVPFLEKILFRRECELFAAENGLNLEERHLEKLEQIYNHAAEDEKVLYMSGISEDALRLAMYQVTTGPTWDERNPLKSYEYTVEYELNGKEETFEFEISSRVPPAGDNVLDKINEHLCAKYEMDRAKTAFASISAITQQVTLNGEYVDSDELTGEDLEDYLHKHAAEFDIRVVYRAVWDALKDAGDPADLNVESVGYKNAMRLVSELCVRISPEIHDMAFGGSDEDLVFNSNRLGYSIFYYNPDSVAGGQIVECPFDDEQALRMLDGINAGEGERNMQDVLCENTQYLSDINTVHFFDTLEYLLYAKLDGNYLGYAKEEVLQKIVQEQENKRAALSEQIHDAASRAVGTNTAMDDPICRVTFCRTGGIADHHQIDVDLHVVPKGYKGGKESFLLSVDERVKAYDKAAEKVGEDTLSDYSILSAKMVFGGRNIIGETDKETTR